MRRIIIGRILVWTLLSLFFGASFEISAQDLAKINAVTNKAHTISKVVIDTKLKNIKGPLADGNVLEEKDVKLVVAFAVGRDDIQPLGDGTLHGYVPVPKEAGLGYSQVLNKINTDFIKEKIEDKTVEKEVDGKPVKVRICKWRVVVFSGYSIWTTILTDASLEPNVALELGVLEAKDKPAGTKIKPMLGATYSQVRRVQNDQVLVFEEIIKDK